MREDVSRTTTWSREARRWRAIRVGRSRLHFIELGLLGRWPLRPNARRARQSARPACVRWSVPSLRYVTSSPCTQHGSTAALTRSAGSRDEMTPSCAALTDASCSAAMVRMSDNLPAPLGPRRRRDDAERAPGGAGGRCGGGPSMTGDVRARTRETGPSSFRTVVPSVPPREMGPQSRLRAHFCAHARCSSNGKPTAGHFSMVRA